MKLLLTRPKHDSEKLKKLLEPLGYQCIIAPLLTIKPTGNTPTDTPDAIIVTSRHAFTGQTPIDAPLYVVGQSTAHEAERLGWNTPKLIAQDSKEFIASFDAPKGAHVLYLRGEDVSANLAEALPDYEWHETITYEAIATDLNKRALRALKQGDVYGVVFFSLRSAALFEEKAVDLNLPPLRAFCLSKTIANHLHLNCWYHKITAQTPNKAALIDAIAQAAIAQPMEDEFSMPKRRPWLAIIVAIMLVTQLGMGIALYALLKQRFTPAPVSPKVIAKLNKDLAEYLQTIEENQSSLETNMAQMQEQLENIPDSVEPESNDDLLARIDALETQAQAPAKTSLTDEQLQKIAQMAEQVAALKQTIEQKSAKQLQNIRMLTSFDRLEERVLSGDSYVQALQAFSIAASDIPESAAWLQPLSDFQHDGMPLEPALMQRFNAAREATLADSSADTQNSIWGEIKRNLSDLVKIRKVGASHSGDDVQSVLARAEVALEQHQYEQLESELSNLPASSHVYFEELKAAIYGRQNLLRTLDVIRAHLSAKTEER